MDGERFDRLARALGSGASRRGALQAALAALLAGAEIGGADAGRGRDRRQQPPEPGAARKKGSEYRCDTVDECRLLDPYLCSTDQCTCQGRKCKVTICHATSSASNPYVEITVAFDAADDDGTGHDRHDDDIIPAPRNGCPGPCTDASCPKGCCVDGICRNDRTRCGGRCIPLDGCCSGGVPGCPSGQTCANGTCACTEGLTCGAGCCRGDQACRNGRCECIAGEACGAQCCAAGQACRNGACRCPDDREACNGTCCAADRACRNGVCACTSGVACGAACCPPGQACLNGACACETGVTCGDACCGAGQTCANGRCRCADDRETCGERCCPPGQSCRNGECACDLGTTCGDACCPAGLNCLGETCGCLNDICAGICCPPGLVCGPDGCACPEGEKPCGNGCIAIGACCTDDRIGCPKTRSVCTSVLCAPVEGVGVCVFGLQPDTRAGCGTLATSFCCRGECIEDGECCVDSQCPGNATCNESFECVCTPDCAGAACGAEDGCGGSCPGTCAGGETCAPNGAGGFACGCDAAACAATFAGFGICCGEPGRTAICVDSRQAPNCGACGNACDDPGPCETGAGACAPDGGCRYALAPDGASCGEAGAACCSGQCCAAESACYNGACCRPLAVCPEGVCGASVPDGCGNWIACPACACEPDCPAGWCGGDGCGGECVCPAGLICDTSSATCAPQCQPDCAGRDCGPDGCGGACGECPEDAFCNEFLGICEATPAVCAELGGSCAETPCCDNPNFPLVCLPFGEDGHICSSEPFVPPGPCAHAGDRPAGGQKCCPRLHLEGGICVINRWDHCDPSNRGRRAFCEKGTRCAGGRRSPHGTPVCVPDGKRRGRGGESAEIAAGA